MKKTLYITLAILVLGGVLFAGTQGKWLTGLFSGSTSMTDRTQDITRYQVVTSAEEAKDLALEARNNAETYASDAETNATEAENAYTNNNADALSTAQSEASTNANNAETAYATASHYADEAYTYYEDAQADFDAAQVEEQALAEIVIEYNDYNLDAQQQLEDAQAEYDDAMQALSDCYERDGCDEFASTYQDNVDEAEDTLDMATDYASNWQAAWENAVDEYTAYYTGAYSDAKDARDLAKDFYEEALTYVEEALQFATNAAQSAEEANSYSFLSCSSLTLDPSSFEMGSGDSSASFDLTATVSASSESSASLWNPQWGQAFTLIELETEVKIDGIIKAIPVTSIPDTSKWIGTLVFEANGYGEFTQDSTTDNPLEISMASAGSETVQFNGGSAGDTITVSVKDEETACSQSFTITQTNTPTVTLTETSSSTALTEGGATDSYTVVLNSAPTADVTITATPDAQATASPSALTFTSTDWSTAQTITVTAVDDSTVEGTHSAVITHTSSSSDTDYNGITVNSITASVTDNDTASSTTDTDADDDGLDDTTEATLGTDPNDSDTDDDGLTDYEEVYTYGTDPLDADSDDDDLEDGEEVDTYDTDPLDADSDDGGVEDGDEVSAGTDPNDDTDDYETDEDSEELDLGALDSDEDCEEDYQDVEEDDWFGETVCRLTEAGFVEGRVQYSSYSLFYPDDEITKAEVLKLISLILLDLDESDASGGSSEFTDTDLTTEWFYWAVINTEDEDVIRTRDAGTIGNFNSNITRGELAVYIARALGLTSYSFEIDYSDVDEDDWFAYAVALLSRTDDEYIKDMPYDGSDEELPVLEGYSDGTFEPYDEINRAEALTMIYRAYQIYIAD